MSDIELAVDRVAAALDWLEKRPVFVGGATIALFLDAFGKAQMRPTTDVDCIVPSADSYTSWGQLEAQLRRRAWSPDPEGPLCRYRSPDGDIVDLMPEDPSVLGFGGRWYPATVVHAVEETLVTGRSILMPAPEYALACKLEAFGDRGRDDPMASKDLEDIVALLDGCSALPGAVEAAAHDLHIWLVARLAELANNRVVTDAMLAQLARGGHQAARESRLITLLARLTS